MAGSTVDSGEAIASSSVAFYEQLIDHLPIAIAVLSPSGSFEYINATGIPDAEQRRQMVGRPLGDLSASYVRDPSVIAERHRQLMHAVETGARVEFDERLTLPSGSHQIMHHTLVPMRDADGRVVRVMAAAIDRTAQHAAEERLRHSQKMEVAGRLAGGVSHDFNNLLTVIRGITDLLREEVAGNADALTMLDELQLAVRRGNDLTRQLLAFSRPGEGIAQPFQADAAVQATSRLVRRLLPERIHLDLALNAAAAWICMEAGALDQVLLNLAANARDAMAGEGTLRIETAIERHPERPNGVLFAGPFVHLAVTDTGHGMPDAVRQRVFEPFFTTKHVGLGTGLGLPTVRALVEQAGGWVDVTSVVEQGTTIHCWLPVVDAPDEADIQAPSVPQQSRNAARRILLVEDEDGVRRVVQRLLTRAGYEVEAARFAQEAIALVADDLARFDVVLTDIYMPGMNGVMLADALRAQRPELPILFMSGHIDDPMLEEQLRDESAIVIGKPFTTDDLLARIHQILQPETDA